MTDTVTPAKASPVVIKIEPGTERCDADGVAGASVVVVLDSGTLALCEHHARQHGFLPAYVQPGSRQ